MDKQTTILILDDDPASVESTRRVLEVKGHRVVAAATCAEATARLAEARPDLIILELILGNRADGMLFARKLRRSARFSRYADIPLLALTGLKSRTEIESPLPSKNKLFLPVDELLEKPADPEALARAIEELLG
ncbi:MAG: response regulator [Elusimicrobiota bacterium]